MSWSASTPDAIAKDSDFDAGIAGTVQQHPDGVTAAYNEQLAAAIEAAKTLAAAVGRPDDHVHLHLSGHANPEHAPYEGWSDETITITVSMRPAPRQAAKTRKRR